MPKVNITIEAPDWCFEAGFPEDMSYTEPEELPDGAETIEDFVVDAYTGKICEIKHFEGLFFKVELDLKKERI